MKNRVIALVDCNNFFVSCERIFRPDLEGKPVVVLSSNDGCAVARSNEAKDLGIPMGAPAFKFREIFRKHNVMLFSGNFELYGDISRRLTDILTETCPRIEVYSVDESFLDITDLAVPNIEAWGRWVRERVLREVGVPVSIGIAPTKTLAKLASDVAKQRAREAAARHSRGGGNPVKNAPAAAGSYLNWIPASAGTTPKQAIVRYNSNRTGVLSLINKSPNELRAILASFPINDVWGVGWRLAPKLKAEGVSNALALSQMSPKFAQQLMGIHGRQMVAELNGVNCHPLEQLHKERQSIARTRTFGEDTSEAYVMEAAIASLTAQAAFRLRRTGLLTRYASVFAMTNKHKPGFRYFTEPIRFTMPTNDSGLLISKAVEALGKFYNPRQSYHRAGVLLYGFVPASALQTDLLGEVSLEQHDRSKAAMAAIDIINARFGKRRIHYAAEDLSQTWRPKHRLGSPRYTTQWSDLPKARVL